MFFIDETTERHAQACADLDETAGGYGAETVIELKGGGSIRCPAFPAPVEYVRVCDDDGRELMYWSAEELDEGGASSSGALGAMLGLARRCVEVGTAPVTVKRWIIDQEDEFGGVTTQEEVLQLAGKAVSKACLFDGNGYFQATDGKFYGVRAVAEIVEVPRSEVEELVGDIEDWHEQVNEEEEPDAGDCDDCGHPWDEHNNIDGCQNDDGGVDCDCPNKRGYDI